LPFGAGALGMGAICVFSGTGVPAFGGAGDGETGGAAGGSWAHPISAGTAMIRRESRRKRIMESNLWMSGGCYVACSQGVKKRLIEAKLFMRDELPIEAQAHAIRYAPGMDEKTKNPSTPPAEDMTPEAQALLTRVQEAIDEVRPALQGDGGDIELLGVTADLKARVRLVGACAGCPSAQFTLSMGVENYLRERVPEITGLIAEDLPGPFHPFGFDPPDPDES
jgi:Fe-S cluster biogenesis protein NfuA